MSDTERDKLAVKVDGIAQQVDEIHAALVGNEMGQKGIVPRLDDLERKVEGHDRKLLVYTAVGGFIVALFQVALTFWKKLF